MTDHEPKPTEYRATRTRLGDLEIRRSLPTRGRRTVGPWCFVDRFGPLSFTSERPMDVWAHPHIGIQTVSWLVAGEIVHRDSLGNESLMRAGGVHVMTSGDGIAHVEQTPTANSGELDGVQLWTALPSSHRNGPPQFQHINEAPALMLRGGIARVFSGTMDACASAARHYSDIIGADVTVHPGKTAEVPLSREREHAILVLGGDAELDGRPLMADRLYHLAPGRTDASLQSFRGARLLLLGGRPFEEAILMWWNFVARTREEIAAARTAWQERSLGDIPGYEGPRIEAPELLRLAEPTPLS